MMKNKAIELTITAIFGNAMFRANCEKDSLKKSAVMMFVRFEMTKAFEVLSQIKLIKKNKNSQNNGVLESIFFALKTTKCL